METNGKSYVWQRLQVLGNARFELGLTFLTTFGVGLIFYLVSLGAEIKPWIVVSLAVVWIVLLFGVILLHEEKRVKMNEKEELEKKINKEHRDESINLTNRVITYSTRSLRAITEELRKYSKGQEAAQITDRNSFILFKERLLRQVFQDIRSVFEGDGRGEDTTTWPHGYFKIALFEPHPTPLEASSLWRTFHDYPEGIDPSEETETFDMKIHQRAANVLSFLKQSIVVIEDIKSENLKPPEVKRWINRRENQADNYDSMVCAAIVTGVKNQPERKCLGVLVIDTNRRRYFLEEQHFQAFLGNLLNPFRTILTFILEVQSYFSINLG